MPFFHLIILIPRMIAIVNLSTYFFHLKIAPEKRYIMDSFFDTDPDRELRERIAREYSGGDSGKFRSTLDRPKTPFRERKRSRKPRSENTKTKAHKKHATSVTTTKVESKRTSPAREHKRSSAPATNYVYLCVKCDKKYKTKKGLIKHSGTCD